MAKTQEWVAVGLIIGGLVLVGILAWAFKKRGTSPSRAEYHLRRVSEPRVVLKNLETTEVVRDQEGNIVALKVHRNVERVEA